MIEVKAITDTESGSTGCEINVNANKIEYMAEIISIIESLMRGLKRSDPHLHAVVFKIITEYPHILLGENEEDKEEDKEDEEISKAKEFERLVATARLGGEVNQYGR